MPTAKRAISSRVTVQNPRPRKYASAAEKQAAFRARFPTICVRVEPKTADTIQKISDASGRTQQETMLSLVKFAITNRDFVNLGLTEHKQLPRMEETRKANPMKRKPTPAQIAARERFAAMARSGAFKKKAAKARKAKSNPAKKTVSQKISQLTREGYPQKQAVAIALNEERAGKVKRNPAPRGFVKADDYTVEVFNKYGMKPYDAVYMQTKGGRGEPIYDLTILKHENGKYLAAHGSVIVKQEFDRAGDVAAYLEEWYIKNRRPAAKRNPRASNPQARSAKAKGSIANPNYRYAVQAGKFYTPGQKTMSFVNVAGFPTKAQAQDYIDALLKTYPKGLTLRIMQSEVE